MVISHASGVAPDVFFTFGRGADEFEFLGLTTLLDPFVERWGQKSDYVPSAWSANLFDDGAHAIPWSIHARSVLLHTRLAEEAGLTPAIPATWDDFAAAARRLTRAQSDRLVQLGHGRMNFHEFYVWVHTAGGDLFTPDRRQSALNSPQAIEALSFVVDLYRSQIGGFDPAGLTFPAQTVAMQIVAPVQLNNAYTRDPEIGRQVAVGPIPRRVRHATRVYVPSLAIWSGSPDKEAAWAWIAFLQKPEYLLAYNIVYGRLPPRLSTLNPDAFAEFPQYMAIADNIVRYGIPHRYPASNESRLHQSIEEGLRLAYEGELSPQASLERVAHEWNLELQR